MRVVNDLLFTGSPKDSFSPRIADYPRRTSLSAEEVVLRPSYSFEEYRPFWTWRLSECRIWNSVGGNIHEDCMILMKFALNIPFDIQSSINSRRNDSNLSRVQTSMSSALLVGVRCMEPGIPKWSATDFTYFLKPPGPDSETRLPLISYRIITNSCEAGGCGGSCWTAGKAPVMI